ncbi:hypothetical protein HY734_02635 [Candidatus Uhrbacteria bacterium]|nr:hypothetical protein [Candidatus Uhrbacteria bacterium]
MRAALFALLGFTVAGIAVAAVSLAHHGAFISGSFCTIGQGFNCDIVNRGAYSEIFGMPVALIGVVGYVFLGLAAVLKLRTSSDQSLSLFLLLASGGGFAFSLYLTGLEAFVLHTWCLLCLTSQTLMAGCLVASLVVWAKERKTIVRDKS